MKCNFSDIHSAHQIKKASVFWSATKQCIPVASVIPPSVMANDASFGGRLGLCLMKLETLFGPIHDLKLKNYSHRQLE
jgi:hypothetical protein